jgi:hypothetical protein
MIRTSQWSIGVWMGAALVVLLIVAACVEITKFPTTKVPDGAQLLISFGCPKDSAKTASDCTVTSKVVLQTGESAGPDWTVDLMVDKGSFVPASGDSIIQVRRLVTGPVGEVSARYHTPSEPGDVTFTLAGQGVVKTETLKVIDRDVGDEPPVAAIALSPSPITVKKDDSVQVTAKFTDAAGNVLPGRLAFFSTENGKASVPAGPAEKVWLKGLDTGTTTLRATRRAILTIVPVTITP